MDFSYKKLTQTTMRPIVPIIMNYKGRAVTFEVLIDSGADINVFDAELGESIGIDIKKGRRDEIKGVDGQSIECWFHQVNLTIPGEAIITVFAAFTYGLPEEGISLVGQKGFFDHFIVRFEYSSAKVSVKRDKAPVLN